jgi:hypothetical protein
MNFQLTSFGTKPARKTLVKKRGFLAYLSRFQGTVLLQHTCKNAQSSELSFSIFCQINLTKLRHWVENIDNSSPLQKMGKLDKSALAGALMLGAAVTGEPALAEDKSNPDLHLASATVSEQVNCVAFVKEQRDLAKETGISMSRRDQKKLLHQCNNGQLEVRIAEQEKIIAALRKRLAELDIILDEQARILDVQGRELARIVAINGQLIIQRKQLDNQIAEIQHDRAKIQANTQQMLDEAERILNQLVS